MPTVVSAKNSAPRSAIGDALRLHRYGPHAWLLSDTSRSVDASAIWSRKVAAVIGRDSPAGLREIIPAFTNLLVEFTDRRDPARITAWFQRCCEAVEALPGRSEPEMLRPVIEMPVSYDGPDLPRIAAQAGCSADAAFAQFIGADYTVRCLGFSPGFPYLAGLPSPLHTPRLSAPRTRVPAGSVAIGGEHAGIYPHASPGGWNLLGRTPEQLFRPEATSLEKMFRLWPGDRVRFRRIQVESDPKLSATDGESAAMPTVRNGLVQILASGMGLTVQDLGRAGYRRFGVPAGGAMDSFAAQAANRLLDNRPTDPVLELCGRGHRFVAQRDSWFAVAGANAATGFQANTVRVRAGGCFEFPAGPLEGLWTYLAVPGGFAGAKCLGSASASPRAGLGRMLLPGDVLASERDSPPAWPTAIARRALPVLPVTNRPLRVWPGPQWALFPDSARDAFFRRRWTITTQSDRVGYRLAGMPLDVPLEEMISEPVLPGSIQVPPDGLPIVTMPDGPTLGGYHKLGLVDPDDLPQLAQSPPGSVVAFQFVAE